MSEAAALTPSPLHRLRQLGPGLYLLLLFYPWLLPLLLLFALSDDMDFEVAAFTRTLLMCTCLAAGLSAIDRLRPFWFRLNYWSKYFILGGGYTLVIFWVMLSLGPYTGEGDAAGSPLLLFYPSVLLVLGGGLLIGLMLGVRRKVMSYVESLKNHGNGA